jgi:hypothetical protein
MTAVDRLREARKQCALAADGDDLTEMQRETARHLAGILDQLAGSVVAYQDDLVVRTDGGSPTTERAVEKLRDEDVRTDGGIDPYGPPPADSPAQRRQREQRPDPSEQCIECGKRGDLFCGCCGFPLCGKHHELGAGFCSEHHTIGGVAVCTYDFEVYVGVHAHEETVLVTDGDADVYHLPDEFEEETASQAPACRPAEDSKVRISLENACDKDMELCEHCADEARERHEQFREEIAAELEDGGSA